VNVICAIGLQIQVHRIRVTARCLAIGGPLHTAALRLAGYWGESPEEIAEVLGLPIPRTRTLLADLTQGGEPIERDFVLWVDHAREHVLPYSALSGVAVRPSKTGPFTLQIDPPTPNRLKSMGLDAGLSWDLGLEGRVEVIEIVDVLPDVRDSRNLPHLLRLPDTQLVISEQPGTATPAHAFSVAQHGVIDPQLTSWTRSNFTDEITKLTAAGDLAEPATGHEDLAELTSHGRWDALEPHPGTLREQLTQAAGAADERLVLSAPDLRQLPAWLTETLHDTHERDVQIVLSPTKGELVPNRAPFPFTTTPAPHQPQALTLTADETHALVHSDPAAILDRYATPTRQQLYATRHQAAIATLRDTLGLRRLRPRAPRRPLTPQALATMLRQALAELQHELPKTVKASIQPQDEQFALETIDRQRTPENPTSAARKTAAGIAWERILGALAHHLATQHPQLQILAERWKPPGARIDLDLILADEHKHIAWVIDAKNSNPTNEQLHKMQAQLRLLRQTPELTGGRTLMGVIVHRKHQLDTSPQPTEHHDILRATPQRLPDLLLAKRLPGERPKRLGRAPTPVPGGDGRPGLQL
jgi:hypothetical protein